MIEAALNEILLDFEECGAISSSKAQFGSRRNAKNKLNEPHLLSKF